MQTIIKLYQSFKAIGLPPKAIPVVLFIYCFGTLFESAGIGMLLPIFEMINSSSDQAVTNYSSLSKIIMDTIEKTGVSINLQSLLAISFSLFLLRQIFSYARLVYLPKTKGNFIKRIRDKGFSRYLRTDTGYQDSTYLGRIINDLTTEVDRTGNALIKYMVVGGQVLNASIYIIILIFMSAKITLSALLIIGISVLILRKLFKKVRATSFLISSANQSLSTFLAEKIKSTRLIRLCSNENLETDKIKNQTEVQKNNIINMQIFLARTSVIIEPIFVLSIFGVAGYSSFCFPIKSYDPELVFISVLFLLSTIIVILVSGSSLVISYNCFNGTAADPSSSILTEISKSIVSSRSVVLSDVFSFVALIKTQFNIGRVVLVGVAFDNFCRASCSSFLDVENFINLNNFLLKIWVN